MMEHEEYNFSLELPYEVITRMDPVDLPPNMRSHYEKYLESEIDKDSIIFKRFKEREKYAANFVLMGEIIHNMIDKDLSFNDAYN
ncbi:MAG: hypothetical protein K2I70_03125, partial [Bacilli bacterium]|nr:hypothetical protein [Bacilli bacterium]